jgi:hypothetical protein
MVAGCTLRGRADRWPGFWLLGKGSRGREEVRERGCGLRRPRGEEGGGGGGEGVAAWVAWG